MYTPIIRCRQSEVLALRELSIEAKSRCMPLLDLPAPGRREDRASAIAYTERNIARLRGALRNLEGIFVDSSELDPSLRLRADEHPLLGAARAAGESGALPIPVTGLHRDSDHMSAALMVREQLANGFICFRLDPTDISTATLTCRRLRSFLLENSISASDAFIVIDLQSVFRQDPDLFVPMIGRFFSQLGPQDWRSIVVGGYGIPDEISDAIAVRQQGYIPRVEQIIYQRVAQAHQAQNLWFADYTVLSPSHVELDWRLMSRVMSPKAIYTLEDSWFVVRGAPFSTHQDGFDQYYDLAAEVVALEEFSGPPFSFGDRYIEERSRRIPKAGNPSSWIKACVNHHIAFTSLAHAGK